MVFELFKITPVIELDTVQTEPGARIGGTLHVTSTSETPIVVPEIWLQFRGECNIRARYRPPVPCTERCSECNGVVARSGSPSTNRELGIKVGDTAGKGALTLKRDREYEPEERIKRLKVTESVSLSTEGLHVKVGDWSINYELPRHETCSASSQDGTKTCICNKTRPDPPPEHIQITVAKTDYALRLTPTGFTKGKHKLRFSIKVPEEYDGQPLPPTFDSRELAASVRYTVSGTLSLSALTWRSSQKGVVVRGGDSAAHHGPGRAVELQCRVLVGTWYKESLRWWPVVKYYLGMDTAARWTKVTLHMTQRDMSAHVGRQVYLQDYLTLRVEQRGTNALPLYVDSVRAYLYTTAAVQADSGEHFIRRNYEYSLMNVRDADYRVSSFVNGDISSVLRGVRIPASVPPSITLPSIQIQHWIEIEVGLRGGSPDGTRQAVAWGKLRAVTGLLNV